MNSTQLASTQRSVPKNLADSVYTISTVKREAMILAVEKLIERGDLSLAITKVDQNGSVNIVATIMENLYV